MSLHLSMGSFSQYPGKVEFIGFETQRQKYCQSLVSKFLVYFHIVKDQNQIKLIASVAVLCLSTISCKTCNRLISLMFNVTLFSIR